MVFLEIIESLPLRRRGSGASREDPTFYGISHLLWINETGEIGVIS